MAIIASQNPFECTPATPARFIGEFASLSALQTAHPTAPGGSYAVVNADGADLIYYYSLTDEDWFTQEGGPGTTPTLPQVLAQGDRTIRLSDGDGETILELNDRGKLIDNGNADYLYLTKDLFPDDTVLKIYNYSETELFGILNEEYGTIIQINDSIIDEYTGITLKPGIAILKKMYGSEYEAEAWILSYEALDLSKEVFGLGSVDNTADLSKPVSTAQAAAIASALSTAQSYTDNIKLKRPARVAIDTNVSLSGDLTVGSIVLVTGDVVLCLSQTDAKQNGLWVVNQLGPWVRTQDFRTGLDVSFCWIPVLAGNYGARFFSTGANRIVGTDNISLQDQTFLALLTGISFSTGTDIVAADTVIQALGKLQKQLTDVRAAKLDKPSWMSQSTPRTLDNTTALQKIFNVGSSGNGSMPVVAGKRYKLLGWVNLSALPAVSKNISFGILGTATASFLSGEALGLVSSALSTPQLQGLSSLSVTQIASNSAATAGRMFINLDFICNGSGNITPSLAISSAASGMTVDSAYFERFEIGDSSATASSDII
jgi:hypothetical protein